MAQQSPLGLPCPGSEVVYECTVPGMSVFWGIPGNVITLIPSSPEVVIGNFRVRPGGMAGGNFTSTLTFTAENGTVITCRIGSTNVSQTVIVRGMYANGRVLNSN